MALGGRAKVAVGFISGVSLPPGPPYRSGDVRYTFNAELIKGGDGNIVQSTPVVPRREYDADDLLEIPARVDDPCIVNFTPDGRTILVVFTEVWSEEDCA